MVPAFWSITCNERIVTNYCLKCLKLKLLRKDKDLKIEWHTDFNITTNTPQRMAPSSVLFYHDTHCTCLTRWEIALSSDSDKHTKADKYDWETNVAVAIRCVIVCSCCEKTKNFSLLFEQRSSFHLVNMRWGNMNNYKPNMIRHTNVLGSHIKQSNQHMNSFIRAGGHTHNKISKGNMKQNKLTNIIEKQMLQLP